METLPPSPFIGMGQGESNFLVKRLLQSMLSYLSIPTSEA